MASCHLHDHSGHDAHERSGEEVPGGAAGADRDAAVLQVLPLLDEEEQGLGVVGHQVLAAEVAALLELLGDHVVALQQLGACGVAVAMEVAAGEELELLPAVVDPARPAGTRVHEEPYLTCSGLMKPELFLQSPTGMFPSEPPMHDLLGRFASGTV